MINHYGIATKILPLIYFSSSSSGSVVLGGIEEITMEEYDKQMNVNTRSVFLLTKLALPELLKTKGNIVNISSVTGLRAVSIEYAERQYCMHSV